MLRRLVLGLVLLNLLQLLVSSQTIVSFSQQLPSTAVLQVSLPSSLSVSLYQVNITIQNTASQLLVAEIETNSTSTVRVPEVDWQSFTTYVVTVRVKLVNETWIDFSNSKSLTTALLAPTLDESLIDINDWSIAWNAVEIPSYSTTQGIVTYLVTIRSQHVPMTHKPAVSRQFFTNDTEVMLSDLSSNTPYHVNITTKILGTSVQSAPLRLIERTLEAAAPFFPPKNVTVRAVNQVTLEFSWDLERDDNGGAPISNHIIRFKYNDYSTRKERTWYYETYKGNTGLKIGDLIPYTRYFTAIASINADGKQSPFSDDLLSQPVASSTKYSIAFVLLLGTILLAA